jgi:hypothetical protein
MACKRALPRVGKQQNQTMEGPMSMLYRLGGLTNRQWALFLVSSALTGVLVGLLGALAA